MGVVRRTTEGHDRPWHARRPRHPLHRHLPRIVGEAGLDASRADDFRWKDRLQPRRAAEPDRPALISIRVASPLGLPDSLAASPARSVSACAKATARPRRSAFGAKAGAWLASLRSLTSSSAAPLLRRSPTPIVQ